MALFFRPVRDKLSRTETVIDASATIVGCPSFYLARKRTTTLGLQYLAEPLFEYVAVFVSFIICPHDTPYAAIHLDNEDKFIVPEVKISLLPVRQNILRVTHALFNRINDCRILRCQPCIN